MPDWACAAGSTLLIPSGPEGKHLFVLLTDPGDFDEYPPQYCVSVNISTIRTAPYDETCVIEPGAHPFVTFRSWVTYRHARIDPASHLIDCAKSGLFVPTAPVSEELLKRIRDGLYKSPQTPNYLKQLRLIKK